jgi:hypothetical protein
MDRYVQIYADGMDERIQLPASLNIDELKSIIRSYEGSVTQHEVVKLYNDYAAKYDWTPIISLSANTREKLAQKIERFKLIEKWDVIFKGLACSPQSSPNRKRRPSLETLMIGGKCDEMYNQGTIGAPPKRPSSASAIVDLYNDYAKRNKWQVSLKVSMDTMRKLKAAAKELPEMDNWEAVMRGWMAHDFFSGRKLDYRPNLMTMLFKSRYMDFYNAGLESPEIQTTDSILDEFKELLV